MKRYGLVLLLLGVWLAGMASGDGPSTGKGHEGDDKAHVLVRPDGLKWVKGPPGLPPGAEIAIVVGDPTKKGSVFVFRAKLPDGYKVPPHWHPGDENVTVLKGTLLVGKGEKFDKSATEELPAGSFMRMPKGMRHFAVAKGETIIQLHGVGPFDIHYINPDDDPRKK